MRPCAAAAEFEALQLADHARQNDFKERMKNYFEVFMSDNRDERLAEMLCTRRLEGGPDLCGSFASAASPQLQNLLFASHAPVVHRVSSAQTRLCARQCMVLGMVLATDGPDNGQLSDADMSVSHSYIAGDGFL
jgi:hypothetical protein